MPIVGADRRLRKGAVPLGHTRKSGALGNLGVVWGSCPHPHKGAVDNMPALDPRKRGTPTRATRATPVFHRTKARAKSMGKGCAL